LLAFRNQLLARDLGPELPEIKGTFAKTFPTLVTPWDQPKMLSDISKRRKKRFKIARPPGEINEQWFLSDIP